MKRRRPECSAAVSGVVYVAMSLALAMRYLERMNPDGISYLAVAQHIAEGRFGAAVNGYWGPLLSWLLAPLLVAGLAPLVAARVLGVATGLAALWGLTRVGRTAGLDRSGIVVLQAAAIPAMALGATAFVTPDMLFLAIWLHYLALVHGTGFGSRRWEIPLAGMLGGAGYLAKPYGFYAFLLHFAIVAVWRWLKGPARARRSLARAYLAGMATFLLVALPWMGALGTKYGGFPVSTSGPYNRALFAPGSPGQPLEHMGFVAPSGANLTSAWEDPTELPLPDWGRIDRGIAFTHQVRLLLDNARRLALAAVYANYALVLALPALLAWLFRSLRSGALARDAFLPFVMAVYPAGYLLIRVEQRYVWVTTFLGLVVAAAVVRRVAAGRPAWVSVTLGSLVVLGAWAEPLSSLRSVDAVTARIRATAAVVGAEAPAATRLAAGDRWAESLGVAWRLGLRFHGVKGDLTTTEAAAALEAQGVDVYLDWSRDGSGAPADDSWAPVGERPHGDMPAVYRRVLPGRDVYPQTGAIRE